MAFNPRTAYANDWQWMHCVDDGRIERRTGGNTLTSWCDVKAVSLDVSSPRFAQIAAALFATADQTLFHVWPQDLAAGVEDPTYNATDKPTNGDKLIIDDEVWTIENVSDSRFGAKWSLSATKAEYATP